MEGREEEGREEEGGERRSRYVNWETTSGDISIGHHYCQDPQRILDRIRAVRSSIYSFFDPLEIPGAFAELRKARVAEHGKAICARTRRERESD